MNAITQAQADRVQLTALVAFYENAFREIRAAALDFQAQDGPDAYHMANIASRAEQAPFMASGAAEEARYAFTGPRIAEGGCAYVGRRTCSHEPSLRPNAYHCPLCAELLPGPWNDTESKAAERMYAHYRDAHREVQP